MGGHELMLIFSATVPASARKADCPPDFGQNAGLNWNRPYYVTTSDFEAYGPPKVHHRAPVSPAGASVLHCAFGLAGVAVPDPTLASAVLQRPLTPLALRGHAACPVAPQLLFDATESVIDAFLFRAQGHTCVTPLGTRNLRSLAAASHRRLSRLPSGNDRTAWQVRGLQVGAEQLLLVGLGRAPRRAAPAARFGALHARAQAPPHHLVILSSQSSHHPIISSSHQKRADLNANLTTRSITHLITDRFSQLCAA